ncbi:hypothetical protein L3Q82_004812 [Scortum barcoo]|uniref:Uncharacterized protein n=1 Tax=Scortum barcoo TaxID=214431 RepID=A0ACB8VD41_9TELE|nr:hypothetical protein L3Q82_004812 [Scortum barcoo]
MAAELGSYMQAHTSSPSPLTLGNSRVVEGPAPLKELGSRAQAMRGEFWSRDWVVEAPCHDCYPNHIAPAPHGLRLRAYWKVDPRCHFGPSPASLPQAWLQGGAPGIPTIQWTFMSGAVSRTIGTWQPGGYSNITLDYSSRVQSYSNGSMGLSDLRLQDAGYYVVTVTEAAGSSRDTGFVLKVNEVLYEDLQYLSVSAVVLACVAGLLMLIMWLLDKAYRRIVAWRRRKRMPETFELG